MPTPPPVLPLLGLWYQLYPSIFGGLGVLVSTIIAMSVSCIVRAVLRLFVLLDTPFTLAYIIWIFLFVFLWFRFLRLLFCFCEFLCRGWPGSYCLYGLTSSW